MFVFTLKKYILLMNCFKSFEGKKMLKVDVLAIGALSPNVLNC